MRRTTLSVTFTLLASVAAWAAAPGGMNVHVEGIDRNNDAIPERFALCQPTANGKSKGGENIRPRISWSGAPNTTLSYAVIVKDPDVPASFDNAGKDGKVVKHDAKRQVFYHWALADIPAEKREIPGGNAATPPEFGTPAQGSLEKYVDDPTQYGGPCPPWNDERAHRYHFTVYALDVAKLNLPAGPTAKDVEKAAAKHALSSGSTVGTYTLNQKLRGNH